MPILKPIPTPNGITAAHRIVKTELTGTTLRLQVHMYPSLDKAEDAHLLWQEYPELPLAALDVQDPVGSLERALAAQPDGLFAGATYVADAAVDDIETARARKWADIKAERDRRRLAQEQDVRGDRLARPHDAVADGGRRRPVGGGGACRKD